MYIKSHSGRYIMALLAASKLRKPREIDFAYIVDWHVGNNCGSIP